MFENVGRSVALLGGAAGLTLCLAGGVAVGVVPQAGTSGPAAVPAAAGGQDVTATTTPDTVAPTTVAPEAPPAPAPTAAPAARSRTRTGTPAAASSGDETPAAATGSAPPAAPSGPTTAARVTPSSAAVKAAIAQIHQRIPLYSPTEAQARQFGDQVCSAFDQGQSGAQVQATAQQMASQIPFVTVSSSDIAFAVRTAVQLFCPGYSSKV